MWVFLDNGTYLSIVSHRQQPHHGPVRLLHPRLQSHPPPGHFLRLLHVATPFVQLSQPVKRG